MSDSRNFSIVPLNDKNFATWKIQIKMTLLREELWGYVTGSVVEVAPSSDGYNKYLIKRDRALGILVMSVSPNLLYLIGDPENPKTVFDKLCDVFQKKTWANRLRLRKRLYSMQLSGKSEHQHLKDFVDIFNELAVLGDGVSDEDQVIHLLASLPDEYSVLVTALEAQEKVPSWDVVTEKIIHQEQKLLSDKPAEVLYSKTSGDRLKKTVCFECNKPGHIRRNCRIFLNKNRQSKDSVNTASTCGLTATTVTSLSAAANVADAWMLDSGATRHMCHQINLFSDFCKLDKEIDVQMGDGRIIKAIGIGKVFIKV